MIEHVNKLFAIIIVLSLLTYFQRADYNLPLFVFVGLLWNHQHPPQKTRVWYLMSFSLIVDLIWIIYWAVIWNGIQDKQLGLCNFTLIVSTVVFVLKIITVIILFLKEEQCNKAIIQLPYNIKSIFTGPTIDQDNNI